MNAIVNVDEAWGIGKDSALLFTIPEDLKFFKQMTLHKAVIMGRKTLESLPGGKPLKNRINIVLTHNPALTIDGALVCTTKAELKSAVSSFPSNDIFLIGGEMLYSTFIDNCDYAYVTKVDSFLPASHHFPNLDNYENWELIEQSEPHYFNHLSFRFCCYRNNAVIPFV